MKRYNSSTKRLSAAHGTSARRRRSLRTLEQLEQRHLMTGTPLSSFVPGGLVLMRGGDSTASQSTHSTGEVPAFLDEYSISVSGSVATATYLGSYAIPADTLTLPGIGVQSREGRLNLSGDRRFLNFVGYQQPVDETVTRLSDGSGT